jgi:hypothetical protein
VQVLTLLSNSVAMLETSNSGSPSRLLLVSSQQTLTNFQLLKLLRTYQLVEVKMKLHLRLRAMQLSLSLMQELLMMVK